MPTGRTSNKDIPTFWEIQIKGKDIVSNWTAGSAQTIEFAIGSDNTSFDSQEISDFYIDSVVLKQEALKYDLNFVSNETAQNMPSKQTITAGRTVTSEPGEPTRTWYKFSGWKKELSGWTLEANNFTFWQTLTSDTKLVASWKKLHKVEFIQKKAWTETNLWTKQVADWDKTNATSISLPANSDWYKFIGWQKADWTVFDFTTEIINADTKIFAVYWVDQTQKIWNYKVNYYLKNSTNPIPWSPRNTITWTAYINENITVALPPIVWYKPVTWQTASFTVNQNNFEKNIYYEVDDWQRFSYLVEYFKWTTKIYSTSKKYSNCEMIPNIIWDYNKDYKINFKDQENIKNQDEVQRLTKVKILNEKWVNNTELFEAARWITRAEFLAIVLQVHCYDVSKQPDSLLFYDVDLKSWQARVVKVWSEIWLIQWYEKDKKGIPFRPDAEISKIEAFWIMMKMKEIEKMESYKDRYIDKKADWQEKPLSTGEYLWILKPEQIDFRF